MRCRRSRSSAEPFDINQSPDVVSRVFVTADAAIVVSDVDLIPVVTGRNFLDGSTKPISEKRVGENRMRVRSKCNVEM